MMRFHCFLSLCALLIGSTAAAQSDDWDLTADPDRKLVAATTTFSNGLILAFRCRDGRYDGLIGGLPEAERGQNWRSVSLQFGDDEPEAATWFVGSRPDVAISTNPGRLARQVREADAVKVRVQQGGEAGQRMRFDIDLPATAAQIDRTLEACGRPLEDPRDALIEELADSDLPEGFEWANAPEPNYPEGPTFERGFVTISCLSRPDGTLRDCAIESEFPTDGGFGEEALRATRRARIQRVSPSDAPIPTRMIIFRTNFQMESVGDSLAPSSGSRLRRGPRSR